jgi:hypothetical protein
LWDQDTEKLQEPAQDLDLNAPLDQDLDNMLLGQAQGSPGMGREADQDRDSLASPVPFATTALLMGAPQGNQDMNLESAQDLDRNPDWDQDPDRGQGQCQDQEFDNMTEPDQDSDLIMRAPIVPAMVILDSMAPITRMGFVVMTFPQGNQDRGRNMDPKSVQDLDWNLDASQDMDQGLSRNQDFDQVTEPAQDAGLIMRDLAVPTMTI